MQFRQLKISILLFVLVHQSLATSAVTPITTAPFPHELFPLMILSCTADTRKSLRAACHTLRTLTDQLIPRQTLLVNINDINTTKQQLQLLTQSPMSLQFLFGCNISGSIDSDSGCWSGGSLLLKILWALSNHTNVKALVIQWDTSTMTHAACRALPRTLTELSIPILTERKYNGIRGAAECLPKTLTNLWVGDIWADDIRNLPTSLTHLSIGYTRHIFEQYQDLPRSLLYLKLFVDGYIYPNRVSHIPDWIPHISVDFLSGGMSDTREVLSSLPKCQKVEVTLDRKPVKLPWEPSW